MKKFLKILTSLINFSLLIFLISIPLIEKYFGGLEDWLILIGLLIVLILNTYFVFLSPASEDWLSLFLQRKALEEKRKIEELKK